MRDFVADLSSEIKPGDVWWLLPTQAAAFLENRDALKNDPAYDTEADGVAISSVSLVLKKIWQRVGLASFDPKKIGLTSNRTRKWF